MFAREILVNRGHDGLPSELLFLPGIPIVLHHSISNLVCEKHEPSRRGLRAVTSGRNTLRQFGSSQLLHQFVWKSLEHFTGCRITEWSRLIEKIVVNLHVTWLLDAAASANFNLLERR
jgi:hypothetical protein